jgi:2-octaprenyl-6-methoxyphenol hydroxylase
MPRDALGDAMLERYVRGRRADRFGGVAFTHGLVTIFGNDVPLARWPRGLALTLLDVLPPARRLFTRAMLFGLH